MARRDKRTPAAVAGTAAVAAAAAVKAGVDARTRRRTRRERRFRLGASEPADEGLRRIARGQLEIAEEGLERGDKAGDGIHAARKALKRTRTLLRLARDELGNGAYREQNARLREAGRRLSGARDAQVMLDMLDALDKRHGDELPDGALDRLRGGLVEERERSRERLAESEGEVSQARGDLETGRAAVVGWKLRRDPAELSPGLRRIYRRGRRAARAAAEDPATETLHELRKRAKDLWYAARVLRRSGGKRLRAMGRDAHRLSDLIGEDHDLAILDDHAARSGNGQDAAGREALRAVISRRRHALQGEALTLAKGLYRRPPRKVARIRRPRR
jgi:CHAD domain-containing protein